MTELEKKIKAKIPGADTGIEVKHSLCAICSPGHHCGVDCYVKDGKIIRVERPSIPITMASCVPRAPHCGTMCTVRTVSRRP